MISNDDIGYKTAFKDKNKVRFGMLFRFW